ncbi:uncharacterized protein METZ01_LOCUS472112, partial [marine metagenome]
METPRDLRSGLWDAREWINRDEKNLCAKGSLLKGFLEKSEHFLATCWNGY